MRSARLGHDQNTKQWKRYKNAQSVIGLIKAETNLLRPIADGALRGSSRLRSIPLGGGVDEVPLLHLRNELRGAGGFRK